MSLVQNRGFFKHASVRAVTAQLFECRCHLSVAGRERASGLRPKRFWKPLRRANRGHVERPVRRAVFDRADRVTAGFRPSVVSFREEKRDPQAGRTKNGKKVGWRRPRPRRRCAMFGGVIVVLGGFWAIGGQGRLKSHFFVSVIRRVSAHRLFRTVMRY